VKTNACRMLDGLGIAYETREYAVDPDDLSGQTVAKKIGLPPEQVFKTLLCSVDAEQIVFAILSVADELDPKKLAAAAGGRRAKLVPIKEVQPLTDQVAHDHPHPLRQRRQAAAQIVLNGLSMIGVSEDGDEALGETSVVGRKHISQPMKRMAGRPAQ
jgi:Cys-tRNA(Pro) deacylase